MLQMKVLLVSPIDPKKPGNTKFLMGGENTYTRTLLKNPPRGVKYVHFTQALNEGLIEYTPLNNFFAFLTKFRILPLGPGIKSLKINHKFDLIHLHAYQARFRGIICPVLLSDSSSNFLFLKDYLGWSKQRIKLQYGLKKLLSRVFKIYDQDLNLYDSKLLVWSHFAKKIHIKLGLPENKIIVLPPGISKTKLKSKKQKNFVICFIGTWFERKGGKLLIKAFGDLKKNYPGINLNVVGELPKDFRLPRGVYHKNYLPREKILKLIASSDCLVLIPSKAEGYGLVVLEAASFGVPAIVSSIYALPEIVVNRTTGFVIKPNSTAELKNALEKLIKDKVLTKKMGREAKLRFGQLFEISKTKKKLKAIYEKIIV